MYPVRLGDLKLDGWTGSSQSGSSHTRGESGLSEGQEIFRLPRKIAAFVPDNSAGIVKGYCPASTSCSTRSSMHSEKSTAFS